MSSSYFISVVDGSARAGCSLETVVSVQIRDNEASA